MSLQDEIDKGSREIATDGYPMSIGEIISLYRDGDIDLHPEFQREFRWKLPQKSKLIESILLGIPLPSVFVFQRKDGVWDVIDGLQRLGTIMEFIGEFKNEDGSVRPQLQLSKTRYLESLDKKYWESEEQSLSLTDAQRRLIKRTKIDIKIIKNDTSETSKYELFDRLNTGGSQASDQEVRDCLLIMANRPLFQWMKALADNEDFKACTALSPRQLEEKYDLELILRFLIFKDLSDDELAFDDLGDYLTERMLKIATGQVSFDRDASQIAFSKTFKTLVDSGLFEDAFRKYDSTKGKFVRAFSISSYEAVSIALGTLFTKNPNASPPTNIVAKVQGLWQENTFLQNSGSGVRASSRIPKTVPLGRTLLGS